MKRRMTMLTVCVGICSLALPAGQALGGKLIKTDLAFGAIGIGQVEVLLEAEGKCGKGRTIELTDNGELVFIGENTGESTQASDSSLTAGSGSHTLIASVEERKIKVKGKKKTCAAATFSEQVFI